MALNDLLLGLQQPCGFTTFVFLTWKDKRLVVLLDELPGVFEATVLLVIIGMGFSKFVLK